MNIEFNPDGSVKLPENLIKHKNEEEKKDKITIFSEKCWDELGFNLKEFIYNMEYLGCFKSKRNWYYGYHFNSIYIVSTGLKEITRFNIILEEESQEVYEIIKKNFKKNFKLAELMNVVSKSNLASERIKFYRENHLEEIHLNDFYNILLQSCYILVLTKKLILDKLGRNVIFAVNLKKGSLENKPNIYGNMQFVKEISDKSLVFKNNKFYFDIRCKNFRGSIAPFLVNEIEHMKKIIQEYKINEQLDVNDIMEKMEYYQRFHDIYQMIIDKNIRNEREKFDFFTSRVKSALRIIGNITNLVYIEKEGRGNIFLRRLDPSLVNKAKETDSDEKIREYYQIYKESENNDYFKYFVYLLKNNLKNSEKIKKEFFVKKNMEIPRDDGLKSLLGDYYGGKLVKKLFGE